MPSEASFVTSHHFLAFTFDGTQLIFSGGSSTDTRSSPDLFVRGLEDGAEKLVASARDRSGSISMVSASKTMIAFVETYREGQVVFRVRALIGTEDVVLDELVASSPDEQTRARREFPAPMVATEGGLVAWTFSRLRSGQAEYELHVRERSGRAGIVYRSAAPLLHPRLQGGLVVFSEGLRGPRVLALRPFIETAPRTLFNTADVSQPALFGDKVVVKRGGEDGLAPAAIWMRDLRTGAEQELAPPSTLAWEPTMNSRYVVWHGDARKIEAWDLQLQRRVVLAEAARDASGRFGVVGRPAAFPGAVVWLATPAGDMTQIANVRPAFHVRRTD